MLNNFFHFIKYNNAAVIILALVLILGGGALAAGPEAIGQKQTSVQGIDNTVLLAADFSAFNMDFKIENLEQDETYYYVTYSFLDLTLADSAWQYQLSQRTQKVSKKIKEDIGVYMAKFLAKHYQARTRELKQEQKLAQSQGEQKRVEVTEYSGLVGRTLDLAATVFPGYEPVVKRELPAPDFNLPTLVKTSADLSAGASASADLSAGASAQADNLTKIYNDYVAAHPEIFNPPVEPVANAASSTPADTTPAAGSGASSTPAATASSSPDTVAPETPADSTSSPSAIPEPTSVNIIELPAPPSTSSGQAAPAPTPESTPTPEPTPAQ